MFCALLSCTVYIQEMVLIAEPLSRLIYTDKKISPYKSRFLLDSIRGYTIFTEDILFCFCADRSVYMKQSVCCEFCYIYVTSGISEKMQLVQEDRRGKEVTNSFKLSIRYICKAPRYKLMNTIYCKGFHSLYFCQNTLII